MMEMDMVGIDPIITCFAPSPTGFLHVGGARTALFNWAYVCHRHAAHRPDAGNHRQDQHVEPHLPCHATKGIVE